MEFDAVIKKRRSVRNFKNKAPSWKDVLEAIDSANQGPFAANHNNLKFLIIEDKEKIKEISKHCEQDWMEDLSLIVIVCSDDMHLENIFGEKGRVYSRQQAGAAIHTFCLKLVDLGLQSCWVGAYHDSIIREMLSIPGHIQIEAIVAVGYGTGKIEKKEKKKLEGEVYWNVWRRTRRMPFYEKNLENYGRNILEDRKYEKEGY